MERHGCILLMVTICHKLLILPIHHRTEQILVVVLNLSGIELDLNCISKCLNFLLQFSIDKINLFIKRNSNREPKVMQLRKRRSVDEFTGAFDPELNTFIICHGWKSGTDSDTVQNIKDNILKMEDSNVIGESIEMNTFRGQQYSMFSFKCSCRLARSCCKQFLYYSGTSNA